ncbi:hypothetical protein Syun_016387 [Stephania yunnanensis]|uniref:Polyadenylate-binding protein n=1 Tax=Stephania yunnanensis TaxID=152371 RepID=A0AAP0J6J6_9MAGN
MAAAAAAALANLPHQLDPQPHLSDDNGNSGSSSAVTADHLHCSSLPGPNPESPNSAPVEAIHPTVQKKLDQTTPLKGTKTTISSFLDSLNSKVGIGGNLFVKNLEESINNGKLYDMFCKYGTILSSKVAMSQDGKSKGYGFVQFDSEESAKSAIENMNGCTIEGKKIYVGKFVKKSDREVPSMDAHFTNLYMKNLDPDLTEEVLLEKFSEFGKVTSLLVSKDSDGNSKGFGFVNFESHDSAVKAMDAMNGTKIGSKDLYVGRAQKKAEREQMIRRQVEERKKEQLQKYEESKVFVKNVSDDVDDVELQEKFSKFGKVTSAKIMRDETGASKGFAFVCLSNPEEACKAVSYFNGFILHGKPLYAAIAQKKEERKAFLQLQYSRQNPSIVEPSPAVDPPMYPPIYGSASPAMFSQYPLVPEVPYQHLGMKEGWNTYRSAAAATPGFQYATLPISAVKNNYCPQFYNPPQIYKQNKDHTVGFKPSQGDGLLTYVPPAQKPPLQQVNSFSELKFAPQEQPKYATTFGVPNTTYKMKNKYSTNPFSATSAHLFPACQGAKMTSNGVLTSVSQQQQKQILGDHIFPFVKNLKHKDAGKLTGMILEMDNTELLRLLDSPNALTAKVGEAAQMLKKHGKVRVTGKTASQPSRISADKVAVN